jgi:hypothetical protein
MYGKSDGLTATECTEGIQPACWRGRDGHLWFATVGGAVWTDPAEVQFNPLPPPVLIEEVSVDGQRMGEDGQPSRSLAGRPPAHLRVPPGRHYLDFKFTALSLISPDKVRFKWRLAGLEKDWVTESSRRSASYSFVQAGDYEFQVQACNNDGVWNETGANIKLTVLPFFWQRWWFNALLVLLVLAFIGGVYSVRIERLRGLHRLRLFIARDLHDEVGANLGSISLLAQIMERHPSSDDAAQVRGIAMETMDTLRDIVWFIDPEHEKLSDLVARLNETARHMLHNIAFHFEQSGDFSSADIPLAFRRNVPSLFKEVLYNILKHARATEVQVTVCRSEGKFQIRITDNGVGFDVSAAPSGNGLKNMRRRAADIGGLLEITTQPGGGTAVILTAPIP